MSTGIAVYHRVGVQREQLVVGTSSPGQGVASGLIPLLLLLFFGDTVATKSFVNN